MIVVQYVATKTRKDTKNQPRITAHTRKGYY